MRQNTKRGRTLLVAAFVAVFAVAAYFAMAPAGDAAGLTPPLGRLLGKRNLSQYALGRIIASVGPGVGTTEVTVSGMLATDHICGLVNLTDPTETQIANSSLTTAAGKVSAASGITNAEKYLVIYLRPQTTGQSGW